MPVRKRLELLPREMELDVATIDRWKGKHSEFCQTLKRGKMAAAICGAIARPLAAVAGARHLVRRSRLTALPIERERDSPNAIWLLRLGW